MSNLSNKPTEKKEFVYEPLKATSGTMADAAAKAEAGDFHLHDEKHGDNYFAKKGYRDTTRKIDDNTTDLAHQGLELRSTMHEY